MKLDQAKRDFYRKKAKEQGYRSRAVFKLIEMDRKFKIFNLGQTVIDVGCAPGGWAQYISKVVGDRGFVLGIDLENVKTIHSNVHTFVYDVENPNFQNFVLSKIPSKADVIASDISPDVSGIWELDSARQIDLTLRLVNLFPQILDKCGSAILKVFQGENLHELMEQLKNEFKNVSIVKPKASRPQSSEIYLVCREKSI